jgi:hypothetical protein
MADGNPNGYYLFHFDGHSVRPQFIPAGGTPGDRLRITFDPQLKSSDNSIQTHPLGPDRGVQPDSAFIVVNFFDGGERDEVTISLDGQAPENMQYIERTDPYYERLFKKFEGTADSFASPAVSSHIWQYPVPKQASGLHYATVYAKDEFGFESQKTMTFEIIDEY